MPVSVKIVVGGLMAFVVFVVAVVTLAITYTVSIEAIHTSGQRLAGSMMDVVVAKTGSYISTGERALLDLSTIGRAPGMKVPIDDPNPSWYLNYSLPIRASMMASGWEFTYFSILHDDGGLTTIGNWWTNDTYAFQYTTDARTLKSTGASTLVNFQFTNKYTWAPYNPADHGGAAGFYPDFFGDQRVGGYYALKGGSQYYGFDICIWADPAVYTFAIPTGDFTITGVCTMSKNATGAYLGMSALDRRLVNIGNFLKGAASTPNTQIFIIDGGLRLIASTYSAPFAQFYNLNENGINGSTPGCRDSGAIPGRTRRVGCRTRAADYPYGPLSSVAQSSPKFLNQTGRDERYGRLAGDNYFYISSRIPSAMGGYTLNLALFMPESDVLGGVTQGMNTAIGIAVAVFVLAVIVTNVLLHVVLAPLDEVTKRMYRVSHLDSTTDDEGSDVALDENENFTDMSVRTVAQPLAESSMTEIRALQVAYETMDTAIKSFTRYVPRDVVRELIATNQICEIAMRPKCCSVLFSDIANFTSMCERVPPTLLSSLVKMYFERTSRTVMGHGGIIDKFIGDCIMGVWGAPFGIEKHEVRAAVCGLMLDFEVKSDPLKSAFADAKEHLAIRCGVATGEVLAGNMGSEMRMNYTVIGDDVNLAARLESLNKQWGTSVMISSSTALECQDWLVMRHVVTIAVVGKEQPVEVYEVIGVKSSANTEMLGAVTSESSENRTLSDVRRDREKDELARIYLEKDGDEAARAAHVASQRPTAGKLLRRAMRKCPVSAEHVQWAEQYTSALGKYQRGDFAGALGLLRDLAANSSFPHPLREHRSVSKLAALCEAYIKTPPPPGFDGVVHAEEK